ncbi:fluoroquinolone export ABC transporter permease subunit [Nocardiopsis nanhaiensis]
MNRLTGTLALEAKLVWRYGVVAVAAVLTVLWTGLLLALPASGAQALVPYLLFLDTAGFGALFAVGLLMFERVEGTGAAKAVTPVSPAEAVLIRVGVLTLPTVAMAVPMVAVTVPYGQVLGALGYSAAGVALTSVLLVAACLGLGARTRTFQGALIATAPALAPLITIPLLHLSGVVQSPLLWAVPTTAGAELISRGLTGQAGTPEGLGEPIAILYAVGCAAAFCWWAARPATEVATVPRGPGAESAEAGPVDADGRPPRSTVLQPARARGRRLAVPRRWGHPLWGLVRYELVGVRRDPLLLAVALAPLPLALALRWAYPVLAEFLRSTYGFDPAAHTTAVFGALVLLHIPVMVGTVVALRVTEDVDDRTLLVLRVSPLSLTAYFGFRTGTAVLLALVGLAIAVPVSGLAPAVSPGLVTAVVLAALFAPMVVLATAAFAGNKVEALVVVKGVGAVSVLAPVLLWVLPAPWWSPLLVLPPTWSLMALPGYPGDAVPFPVILLSGSVVAVAAALVLVRRIRSRLLT